MVELYWRPKKNYNFLHELGSNTHGMKSLKKVSYSPCLGDGRVWISTVKVFQCPRLTFYHKGPACKLQTFRCVPICLIDENSSNCDLTIFIFFGNLGTWREYQSTRLPSRKWTYHSHGQTRYRHRRLNPPAHQKYLWKVHSKYRVVGSIFTLQVCNIIY